MKFWRRQPNRTTKPQQVTMGRNNTGPGGVTYMCWEQPPGTWNYMQPEHMEDMHELVRLVSIMFDNMEAGDGGTPTDTTQEPGPQTGSAGSDPASLP